MQNSSVVRPTVQDIARECGVTAMTVSRALSGRGRVAKATQQRVQAVAHSMGYEPNPHALHLRRGSSRVVIVFSGIHLPSVYGETVERIQQQLLAKGFEVPLYSVAQSDGNPKRQAERARAVRLQRPLALIGSFSHLHEPALDEMRQYIARGGQVVSFGRPCALDCGQVVVDYQRMVAEATRHLLQLGHRRIGFYGTSSPGQRDVRREGFLTTMAEAGVEANPQWIWSGPAFEEGGRQCAQRFLAAPNRPTAMVFLYDVIAGVFINELARAGVRVPAEVSVVTIGDTPLASCWRPALSAVSHPVAEVANKVVEMLNGDLDGVRDGPPLSLKVCGSLTVRESTAPAPETGA